jgi:S-adenosylmethionine synthetase
VSIHLNPFGTEKVDIEKMEAAVRKVFDLRPRAIIARLDLLRPIYKKTAAYGHFGREDQGFPWEVTDRTEELKRAI